jgi:hypothetical protein
MIPLRKNDTTNCELFGAQICPKMYLYMPPCASGGCPHCIRVPGTRFPSLQTSPPFNSSSVTFSSKKISLYHSLLLTNTSVRIGLVQDLCESFGPSISLSGAYIRAWRGALVSIEIVWIISPWIEELCSDGCCSWDWVPCAHKSCQARGPKTVTAPRVKAARPLFPSPVKWPITCAVSLMCTFPFQFTW